MAPIIISNIINILSNITFYFFVVRTGIEPVPTSISAVALTNEPPDYIAVFPAVRGLK